MKKLSAYQVIKTVLGWQTLLLLVVVMFLGQMVNLPNLITGLVVVGILVNAGRRLGRNRVVSHMERDEKQGKLHLRGYLYRGRVEARKSTLKLDELSSARWIPATWSRISPRVEFLAKDGDSYTVMVSPDHIGADDVMKLNAFLRQDDPPSPSGGGSHTSSASKETSNDPAPSAESKESVSSGS